MNLEWKTIFYFCIFYNLVLLTKSSKDDSFAAIEDLKLVLRTEQELINFLNTYFEFEIKTPELENIARPFLTSKFMNIEDEENFLGNLIHVYLLIKHLTIDWTNLTTKLNPELLKKTYGLYARLKRPIRFPTDNDLKAVARAFVRLQQMYDINPLKVAEGELVPGIKTTWELSAQDCYEIAKQLNEQEEFYYALPWLDAALKREEKERVKSIKLLSILARLAYNHFMIGNFSTAFLLNKQIIEINPHNQKAHAHFATYEKQTRLHKDVPFEIKDPYINFEVYKMLCKNEFHSNPSKTSKLKCYYVNGSPFLILQPVKIEDLHLEPRVSMFYDVVSDRDIRVIKDLATPALQRANVSEFQGRIESEDYRVGKNAWIADSDNQTIAKISLRLQEITGLDLVKAAEDLQVLNYGIGGHYDPHFDIDIARDKYIIEKDPNEPGGERIATLLLYLSDVERGGATVFPELEIAAWPKKGAAVFWYNILKSGKDDLLTRHAACPVLLGVKWVANKWIHEHNQEHRRPCGLTENDIY